MQLVRGRGGARQGRGSLLRGGHGVLIQEYIKGAMVQSKTRY